ncbi:MAG TPA: AAA family ATPase [Gammaproteobacteria bacterium]|nr:AAA family ATPase [Gammaproteobacteria bacterium]
MVKSRLKSLRDEMAGGLIERETPVQLALLSALAGEHLLLIGPPGTAKSILARRLHQAFQDSAYFERLLTRFSVPEELFGPLSIRALEDDRYERQLEGYLPTANIAFIDEIFKANSAILNALLTLLNEREFDNGCERISTPLVAVIGASNELPQEEELEALFDRFLCRYETRPVSNRNFTALLTLDESGTGLPPTPGLTRQEIQAIQTSAESIKLPDDIIGLLQALREFVQQQHIYVSDRRWRKAIKLLKVAAATNGQPAVSVWDCSLLQHCLWREPAQRKIIADWYQNHIGIGSGFNPERLEKLVHTWEQTLQADLASTTQKCNQDNERLYLDPQGELTTTKSTREYPEKDGQPLFLAPPDQEDRTRKGLGYTQEALRAQYFDDVYQQCHINGEWQTLDFYTQQAANRLVSFHENEPAMEATRHPEAFIQSRIKESSALHRDIEQLNTQLQQQVDALEQTVTEHLWLPETFIDVASRSLSQSLQKTGRLTQRMHKVIEQYQTAPRQ